MNSDLSSGCGGETLSTFGNDTNLVGSDSDNLGFDSRSGSSEDSSFASKIRKKSIASEGENTPSGAENRSFAKSAVPIMQAGNSGESKSEAPDYSKGGGFRVNAAAGALNRGIIPESLRRMQQAEEMYEAEKKSSSSKHSNLESIMNVSSGQDRFVPSHKDIIKEMSKMASADSGKASGSHSSGSVRKSSSSKTEDKRQSSEEQKAVRQEEQRRKLIAGAGVLCFLLGALVLTFIYSPLNDGSISDQQPPVSQTEPVLDGTNKEALVLGSGGSDEDDKEGSASDQDMNIEIEGGALHAKEFKKDSRQIKVYVVGAVKNPGMVTLPFEARVDDAVKAAGGMTENAESLGVNLAKRVKDEDKIYIPLKNAAKAEAPEIPKSVGMSGVVDYNYSNYKAPEGSGIVQEQPRSSYSGHKKSKKAQQTPPPSPAPAEPQASQQEQSAENQNQESASPKIDINTATEEELQQLPGVGPSISKSIVDYRSSLPEGKFTKKEQLQEVIGVGKGTYGKIEAYVEDIH